MFMHVRSPRQRPEDDGDGEGAGNDGAGQQHPEYHLPSQAPERDEHLTSDLEDGRLVASFHHRLRRLPSLEAKLTALGAHLSGDDASPQPLDSEEVRSSTTNATSGGVNSTPATSHLAPATASSASPSSKSSPTSSSSSSPSASSPERRRRRRRLRTTPEQLKKDLSRGTGVLAAAGGGFRMPLDAYGSQLLRRRHRILEVRGRVLGEVVATQRDLTRFLALRDVQMWTIEARWKQAYLRTVLRAWWSLVEQIKADTVRFRKLFIKSDMDIMKKCFKVLRHAADMGMAQRANAALNGSAAARRRPR